MPPKKRVKEAAEVKTEEIEPFESLHSKEEVTHLNDSTIGPLTHDCNVVFT